MKHLWKENKRTLALAVPIMAGQLGQMLLGLADTLMIGRVGTVELAASAFVNVMFHIPIVAAVGLAAAVSVHVSHAHGAGKNREAGEAFRHGLLLASACGVAMAGLLIALIPMLHLFRQPAEVMAVTPPYLVWVALSTIPMVPSLVCKSFAESKNHPWPVFWLMLGGVGLNVFLNTLLIFGMWGFPEMGLTGAGVATFLARTITFLAIWGYLKQSRTLATSRPLRWLAPLRKSESVELIRMATPISGQMLMEFGAFAAATLLVGQFGSVSLAAHHIALTCAATTFMVPLGLAMALTIRVGHTLGAGEPDRCRRIILGAYLSAFLFMCAAAAFFIFGREWIAHGFTDDPRVIELTLSLLLITAVFQIFDGGQIISMGALRGLKDVNLPTALVFACCWLFGLPLGIWLAFFQGGETIGQWWGLALGLALTAVMLTLRLVHQMSRFHDLARDTPAPDTVV